MGFRTDDGIGIADNFIGFANRFLIVAHDFVFLGLVQFRFIGAALIDQLHGQTLRIVL